MKYNRVKNYLRDIRSRDEPDVYVFSYGGCGTRTFYEFLKKHYKLNSQPHVHYGRIEDVQRTLNQYMENLCLFQSLLPDVVRLAAK